MSTSPASSRDSLPKNWNILVISFVICGCTVLLVLSYFSILRRLCFRFRTRTLSGNRLQRRRLSEANPDDPSLQFQSYGLDASVVQALPVVQFKGKRKDEEEANKGMTDCAVCLGEFEDGEWIKHLPNCTHVFHVACIDTWFESHSNCPLCRSHVLYSNDDSSGFGNDEECPVSVRSLLETLRREEFYQERTRHYQILRSDILHNTFRNEPTRTI